MISLQLFEQSFKVALAEISFLGKNRQLAKNINPQTTHPQQFLKEKYLLKNGRVIRRGDIKSRIRHIKQNYLEPYDGYREMLVKLLTGLSSKKCPLAWQQTISF